MKTVYHRSCKSHQHIAHTDCTEVRTMRCVTMCKRFKSNSISMMSLRKFFWTECFLFEHQKLELVRKKTGRAAIKIHTREMPSTRMKGVAEASGSLPSNSGLVGYWLFHLQQNWINSRISKFPIFFPWSVTIYFHLNAGTAKRRGHPCLAWEMSSS